MGIFKLYWDALKAALVDIADKNVSLIAAGVAFYAMLSLFPAIAALVTNRASMDSTDSKEVEIEVIGV